MRSELVHERITHDVIGAFYDVYNTLRYGYLESVYVGALSVELAARGVDAEREVPIQVLYRGVLVGSYRADLVVQRSVVVEVKAGRSLHEGAEAQLLNYLRGTGLPVGLLMHFGPEPCFKRVVLTRPRGAKPGRI